MHYWRMCREKNCRGYEPGLCYAAASCAAGIVVAWIAPELLTPEAVFALLAVEILTVGLGAGAAVRCLVQRLCFARVRVDGAEDLRPEKRRRRWFLLYWLVLLALYAGASVAFQSGTLFLFVPMAGLFLYGLGAVGQRPGALLPLGSHSDGAARADCRGFDGGAGGGHRSVRLVDQ